MGGGDEEPAEDKNIGGVSGRRSRSLNTIQYGNTHGKIWAHTQEGPKV